MSEQGPQMEQVEDTAVMPIMVEREKLRIRIRNGVLKLFLCKIDDLSAKFILELQRDLEEWETCPRI